MTFPLDWLWVPPCGRAYFLLLRQKKVAKEKATPRSAVATRLPCATRPSGRLAKLACGSDNASRLPPDSLRCSAPLTGTRKTGWLNLHHKECLLRSTGEKAQKKPSQIWQWTPWGPLRGAEQRRNAGGLRFAMFEPQASSGKPPGVSSSARNRRSRHRPRVAFFLLTFSWRSKKK